MSQDDLKEKHAEINPAARRDEPGEPHQDLVRYERGDGEPQVKPFQGEPLDPLDPGGIED